MHAHIAEEVLGDNYYELLRVYEREALNKKTKEVNSKELANIQFGRPLEMKIEDALFVKMKKNMLLVKDLNNPKIHYSFFWIGSTFDMHITSEDESDPKKRHIPLVKLKIDWAFLLQNIFQDFKKNMNSVFRKVKIDDPYWQDMEITYLTPRNLQEMIHLIFGKKRWNINEEFFEKLNSLPNAKLINLVKQPVTLGWSSEGYWVLSNGIDCWILDVDKLFSKIDKYLDLSIRQIEVKYFTLRILTLLIKIRLLNFRRKVINVLGKKD